MGRAALATGTVIWPAKTGLKVYTIRHPIIEEPLAVMHFGAPPFMDAEVRDVRERPRLGESESQFVGRINTYAQNSGAIIVLKFFLPLPGTWQPRRCRRVSLED